MVAPTMKSNAITFEIPEERLSSLVTELQSSIEADCGTKYSESVIRNSVVSWLNVRLDSLFEDAVERLTSPTYDDARQFAQMLDAAEPKANVVPIREGLEAETAGVFNGYRPFSLEKMAAMTAYIAARTSDLYKTKLNKLLFYSDFINFYVNGSSISGSRYVHLPYGPVPDAYEETLETLNHYGVIDVTPQNSAELISIGSSPAADFLTDAERNTLDWVLGTYGPMTASQLTEVSHREKAYSNTRAGEEIAYGYAKFIYKLPDKTA